MKDIKFLKSNLIAHRGLYNNNKGVIENTMLAFKKAMECEYIIELDVHAIKDSTVVVFHDDNIKRLTGIDKKLRNCTYKEIKDIKLDKTNETIPTLNEVLKYINGKVPVIIELKYDTRLGILEKQVMNILKEYKGEYAIQSFNPLSIAWVRYKQPQVIRGQIASEFVNEKMSFLKRMFLKNMLFNFISNPDYISYSIENANEEKILKLKKKYLMLGWTIKNKEEFNKYKDIYDNLICENILEC